jgi:hypothetical protein
VRVDTATGGYILSIAQQEQALRVGRARWELNRAKGCYDRIFEGPPLQITDPVRNDRDGVAGQLALRSLLGLPECSDEDLLTPNWWGGYPAVHLPDGRVTSCRSTIHTGGYLLVSDPELADGHYIPDLFTLMIASFPHFHFAGCVTHAQFLARRRRLKLPRPCWGVDQLQLERALDV